MEREPKKYPRLVQALLQSLFIAAYVLVAFLVVYRFGSKLAMASIAASAFIAFGFPAAESGRPRYLVGGYVCAVVSGLACATLFSGLPGALHTDIYFQILFSAVAVFLTAFLMQVFKLQHPPSCALAVSLVLEPNPWLMGLIVMGCIIALSLFKWATGRWLVKRCD